MNAIIPLIPGYAQKLEDLKDKASVIPPSGAIAGLYVSTDNKVGVWQAPANAGLAGIKDLCVQINDSQQAGMNVDPLSGKSVNAIRFFKGKGILVWGSRTLDGGSTEWKYIPVRRLFSYVEQSVKLSTAWAVFEPNDANTWVKIKCQISNFLSNLWRAGALAGASADEAFFVEVGKDITMTEADINDGYLRVRIGLAAVRPAEFIILEFSHKVQE
jgi:phage tail sheath protein FI